MLHWQNSSVLSFAYKHKRDKSVDLPSSNGAGNGSGGGVRFTAKQNTNKAINMQKAKSARSEQSTSICVH